MPGKIISTVGAGLERSAQVDFSGVRREVSLAVLPEAKEGDFVIVHVGIAISCLDTRAAEIAIQTHLELNEMNGTSAKQVSNETMNVGYK